MNLLIHDLPALSERIVPDSVRSNTVIISSDRKIHSCKGCFDCWIKTPTKCSIRDNYANMGLLLSKSDCLILISQCFYGGYSPFVSNVLNRSISYTLPYFEIRNNETRHPARYNNRPDFKVYLYGEITRREQETARKLAQRNGINLLMRSVEVHFYDTADDICEVLP
jgi:multimeric flavodoxin WrbA